MAILFGTSLPNFFFSTLDPNDRIDGAGDSDTVSYNSPNAANGSVVINLSIAGPQNTGGSGVDELISIENIIGSSFADRIMGNTGANVIDGGSGSANDYLDGAGGMDTVSYASAGAGVTVSLAIAGLQNTFGAGTDTLLNFENLSGSKFADVLSGNAGSNVISGGDGGDVIKGSAGTDRLDGGNRVDTADYSALGVTVVLGAFGMLSKGPLGTDTLVGIERIVGSSLAGDRVDLSGAVAPATGTFTNLAAGVVTISGGGAPLPLTFSISQFENVTGSGFADSIIGDAGANTLSGLAGDDTVNGGLGNDVLDGGTGIDTASYEGTAAGVAVSLALQGGVQNTVSAGSDLLTGFENLIGSSFNDTLSGNALANRIQGGGGGDLLVGGAGVDRFVYRAVTESGPALSDRITDFASALLEQLDLGAIDANNAIAGDQAFSWLGAIASPVEAIGQGKMGFFYDAALNRSLVLGNTSSSAGVADFRVQLDLVSSLSAANFVL